MNEFKILEVTVENRQTEGIIGVAFHFFSS